jgi:hypothetical protein
MPQLVKRGKYVFGWTIVHPDGNILLPPEAQEEYRFKAGDKLIIMNGSETSGGFAITTINKILNTPLLNRINQIPELSSSRNLKNGYLEDKKKIYTWSTLENTGYFMMRKDALKKYSIKAYDKLLVVKGSGLALGLIQKGRIFNEALKHPELKICL